MISADDTILYTILYTGTAKDIKTISSLEIKYLRGYNKMLLMLNIKPPHQKI